MIPKVKRNKHGNKKVIRCAGCMPCPGPKKCGLPMAKDAIVFDSEREAKRDDQLMMLQRSGYISDLKRQVAFVLVPSVKLDGKTKPAVRYFADHTYNEIKNGFVVEDSKSPHLQKNPVYRLKKHLMKHVHNIDVVEV